MPKTPVQIGNGTRNENLIEDIIYNEKDYAFQAKILSNAFLPAEIIKQLRELKQKVEAKNDPSELRKFIYNSRLLIVELIKANPKSYEYGLINHYVLTNKRNDRIEMRKKHATLKTDPDILAEFHKLMKTDHNPKTADRAILREVRHAWQSIRRVARTMPPTVLPPTITSVPSKPEPPEPVKAEPPAIAVPKKPGLVEKMKASAKNLKARFQRANEPTMEIQFTRTDTRPQDNIPSVQEKPPETEEQKRQKQLAYVEKEMLDTEKDYIHMMGLLKSNINILMTEYDKNKDQYIKEGKVTPETLNAFLESTAAFSDKHSAVLQAIHAKDYSKLASSLKELQKAYSEYMVAYGDIIKNIPDNVNNVLKQNPAFKQLNLDGVIAKPFQRVLKYPGLLMELLKATPEGDPNKQSIQDAHSAATQIAASVNAIKKQADVQQFIKDIQPYKNNPTTAQLKEILNNLDRFGLPTNQKAQILRSINLSAVEPQRLAAIQAFAKANQDVAPILVNIVTSEKLLNRLAKEMPKDVTDPRAIFLKSLMQQIKIRSSMSLEGIVNNAKEGTIKDYNTYRNKGAPTYEQNKDIQAIVNNLVIQYQGVVGYEHKQVKDAFSNPPLVPGFKVQQASDAASRKEAATRNAPSTTPETAVNVTPTPTNKRTNGL